MKHAAIAAALALAACQPATQEAAAPAAPVAPAAAEAPTPLALKPSGPPRVIQAESEESDAAWVTDVHVIDAAEGAKVFSTAGGDPAINGLYTFVALYNQPDGWTRVFQIGDFNSWEVVEESAERFTLKVSRSWIEEGTGDVKTAEEHLIVTVPGRDATTLEVTPAA